MMLMLHGHHILKDELTRGVKVLRQDGTCVCYICTSTDQTDAELVELVEAMCFHHQAK